MSQELFQDPHFWVAAAFILFVLMVAKPLGRIAAKALDERSAKIASELAQARKLREEAEALLAIYKDKQQASLKEAEEILAKTQEDAVRISNQAEEELKVALEKRMKLSMEKIAQAENKALKEVQDHVVDIAIAAARTLIAEHLARGGTEDIIRQVASELERKLH